MRAITRAVGILCFALAGPTAAAQPGLPVFDAHIHYSQADWSVYTPEAILSVLDRAGVRWAAVSSTPDEGTLRLHAKSPERVVPVLRPYRTRDDMGTWTTDASLVPYVTERLARGIYRGIGEFHLSAAQAGDPVVQAFAGLAERRNLFLYAHTDAAGIEALVRRYPRARWLWAHAGLGEPFEAVRRVMESHPGLRAELSLKSEVAAAGRIDPRWHALFLQHPDRFLVGTDTWVTSQWDRFAAIQADLQGWLAQLPRDLAERLAFRNAKAFMGLP
jgi:hypothetical protein